MTAPSPAHLHLALAYPACTELCHTPAPRGRETDPLWSSSQPNGLPVALPCNGRTSAPLPARCARLPGPPSASFWPTRALRPADPPRAEPNALADGCRLLFLLLELIEGRKGPFGPVLSVDIAFAQACSASQSQRGAQPRGAGSLAASAIIRRPAGVDLTRLYAANCAGAVAAYDARRHAICNLFRRRPENEQTVDETDGTPKAFNIDCRPRDHRSRLHKRFTGRFRDGFVYRFSRSDTLVPLYD